MHSSEQVHITERDKWVGWETKRRMEGKKIARSISKAAVDDLTSSWYLARQLGQDLNRFVTIRPHNIDDLTPDQRQNLFSSYRNKLGQFARDNGFEFTHVWSRESDPKTGHREHMHLLMHVPKPHSRGFKRVVAGWAKHANEIDVKPCSYQTRLVSGKVRSMIGYLTKNSPQAAYKTPREYRLGGPVFGKRTGCSANLNARAQLTHDAHLAARRDLKPRQTSTPTPSVSENPVTCPPHKRRVSYFRRESCEATAAVEVGRVLKFEKKPE